MPKPSLRDALLEAGMTEFHQHGYNGTGVSTIAATASAPKGSFYNHFASKQALAIELLDRFVGASNTAVLTDGTVAPAEALRTHFRELRDKQFASDYRGCMLGNFTAEVALDSPEMRAAVVAHFDSWVAKLAVTIARGKQTGDVGSPVDAEVLAGVLLDSWEGALLRSKARGDLRPLDDFLEVTLPALLML